MKKLKILNRFKKDKEKKPKEKKVLWKTILSIILVLAIIFVSIFLVFALYIVITSPDFEQTELYQTEPSILYDKNGDEITRVGAEDSTVISYENIPDVLIDALVATEDSRFFQHNGIDLFRFIMATGKTLLGSKDAGGASTLSMQVIKNTYTQKGKLESNKIESLVRKFRDIYMAVFKLEANYTKEEIIEFYFNSQWFANSATINTHGTYGIERASQYYFGKSAKDINLAEASMMVGMFQNPRLYNPYRNPEGCRNRQKVVLKLMVRHGYITEEEMNAVLEIPISSMLVEKQTNTNTKVDIYQAFVDYVIDEVEKDLGVNARQVSLKIYTTYDPNVQKVLSHVEEGDTVAFPDDVVQIGIAVTSTVDGSITALSGGRNYQALGLNRATDMNNQPGSTAKPLFDYAMYIEHINQSTYEMFLDDEFTYSNGSPIGNYDKKYKGFITMRYALEDSRNIPALTAFKRVYKEDPDIIKNFVHSVGINYGDELYESASIGGFNGVSPLELSAAYASFGRGGYYIKPYAYTKVVNNSTGVEVNHSYKKVQVMEESTAFMINDILIGAYTGKSASGSQTAGKTGTTNLDTQTKTKYGLPDGAVKDIWMVTYSPSHSIALWYGYDQLYTDSAEKHYYLTSSTGRTSRVKIMNSLATGIHQKNTSFKKPSTVTQVEVEKETIPPLLCSEFTPRTGDSKMCLSEYFVKGTEPTEVSKRYDLLSNPTNGKANVNSNVITLSWDPIATPEAIDTTYLTEFFTEYFDKFATKYYQKRLEYNSKNIGTLGYEVYLKNGDSLKQLGYTSNNSFIYTAATGGEYEFVIKSAYSIFKDNRSTGLTIKASAVDPNANVVETPLVDNLEPTTETN